MKRFLMGALFVSVLLATLIATLPLGFVVQRAGLERLGITWAQAEGSLWRGRVSGVILGGQAIGDVSMTLRPASLLTGTPVYDIQWGGAAGRGSARLALSSRAIEASDARAQYQVSAFERLSPSIRAAGGSVRVSGGRVRLTAEGCETGAGTITSDALTRLASQYGHQFGPVEGRFSCEERDMRVTLNGQSETGDRVDVDARAGLASGSSVSARVETVDRDLILALSGLGFELQDGLLQYDKQFKGKQEP